MILLFSLTVLGVVLFWGWYSSDLVLSMPREPLTVLPDSFGLRYENVSFFSSDGTLLKGWFVPAADESPVTIILCHGRSACRSNVLSATQHLALRGGYNLFYFDFRAHGESGGKITTLGRSESMDLNAAVDWVRKEKPSASRRLGVYGMSMGAAVAIITAADRKEIEAVAAESPFASVNRSVARYGRILYGLPRWAIPYTLIWVRARLGFDPEETSSERFVARLAPRPFFLLQGGGDDRVPPSEGEKLFALAGEPKTLWTVPGANHAGLWEMAGRDYEDRLLSFFNGVFSGVVKDEFLKHP